MKQRDNLWLIRVAIADRPGALAGLATTLSVHDVNLLRIDVVSQDDMGVAVDDLWVELPPGGRMDSLELVLRRLPGVAVRATVGRAPPDDPVDVMASAAAALARARSADDALQQSVDAGCLVARAQHAALVAAEPDGSLRVLASTFGPVSRVEAYEPSIARDATREGVSLTVPGSYPWASPAWVAATCAASVAAVPLASATGLYACLIVTRSHPMAFEAGELARLKAFGSVITATLAQHGLTEPSAPLTLMEAAVAPQMAVAAP